LSIPLCAVLCACDSGEAVALIEPPVPKVIGELIEKQGTGNGCVEVDLPAGSMLVVANAYVSASSIAKAIPELRESACREIESRAMAFENVNVFELRSTKICWEGTLPASFNYIDEGVTALRKGDRICMTRQDRDARPCALSFVRAEH
jgi:hypothetical protein